MCQDEFIMWPSHNINAITKPYRIVVRDWILLHPELHSLLHNLTLVKHSIDCYISKYTCNMSEYVKNSKKIGPISVRCIGHKIK